MNIKLCLWLIGYLVVGLATLGLLARYIFTRESGDEYHLFFSCFLFWPVAWLGVLLLFLSFSLERYVAFCRKGKRSQL